MAIYHCSIKIISRGKGKSAVGAAAYRSGEKLTNEYDGLTHDYTRKGGVVHTEILLSEYAPSEYADRSTLWNAVEKVEKARNSQLAREIEISLPNELSRAENIELARRFVQEAFVNKGMCADLCVHDPDREQPNIHAHIMLTLRPFNEDGTWGDKQRKEYILDADGNKIYDKKKRTYKCRTVQTTDWNDKTKAEEWRAAWADFLNAVLTEKGIAERVDHRSFERQGKLEQPTIHLGAAVTQMERKGIRTVKGDINRRIQEQNDELHRLQAELERVNAAIAELNQSPQEENLVSILMRFYSNGEKFAEARGLKLGNLKKAQKLRDVSQAVAFLQGNHISTMTELSEKHAALESEYHELKDKILSRQKRIKALHELLDHYEIFKPNKAVYDQWKSITNQKKKDRFYAEHGSQIEAYKAMRSYFKSTLGEGEKITPKAWQSELAELESADSADMLRLHKLEDDTALMATILYNVEHLQTYEERGQEIQKKRKTVLE
ncbi:MAG: MobA/MobL family protein [Ruminiclostridium sp.]|nr:MobA/MobL family protein [Ruminococcus sp.]MBR1832655.1 MobA/MobL family protein [Ruminiclostridium sp.]